MTMTAYEMIEHFEEHIKEHPKDYISLSESDKFTLFMINEMFKSDVLFKDWITLAVSCFSKVAGSGRPMILLIPIATAMNLLIRSIKENSNAPI